ncbi:MAG: hypothetical protein P0Y53_13725 [Candidatus Pseudobacter hemicellulosilyticus]|uniref:Lanthionine synthetase-like protein n=1 Tax=Candidatus Pseudobacter hemicellulosilyticus TaxID=3121375 RepID=A0AAJ6BFY8_9BACT|nr:MAG: hypothetical protein P0Y53_13725 [Pseudobacter sp.]
MNQLIHRRFVNYILLNASFQNRIGLFDGKTAVSIYLAMAAEAFPDFAADAASFSFLEEIQEHMSFGSPLGFGSGMAGYGCVLEYLAGKDLLAEDTSELLEEPEKHILGFVYRAASQEPGLNNGISGMGMYLLQRLKSKTPPGQFQQLLLKEAAIGCVDQLRKLWDAVRKEGKRNIDISLWNGWPGVVLFLNELRKTGWFEPEVTAFLQEMVEFLWRIVQKNRQNWHWDYLSCWLAIFQAGFDRADYTLHPDKLKLFDKQLQFGFASIEHIAARKRMWYALELSIIERQFEQAAAGKAARKIKKLAEEGLEQRPVPELFPPGMRQLEVPVGLLEGVCGTALPLLTMETGRYDWLSMFGIFVKQSHAEKN